MKIGVYAGSFDPLTYGHIDVIERALKVFDQVVLLVAENSKKKRGLHRNLTINLIRHYISERDWKGKVYVDATDELTIQYAADCGACSLIRGIRTATDFEYENQLAMVNRALHPEIETVFFVADQNKSHISSSAVRELLSYGQDVSAFMPDSMITWITERGFYGTDKR